MRGLRTSAISISLRPNAARETSDQNVSRVETSDPGRIGRTSDFEDHFEGRVVDEEVVVGAEGEGMREKVVRLFTDSRY